MRQLLAGQLVDVAAAAKGPTMSAIAPTAPPPRGPLDRFLRIFTDVHDGEGGQVLLLAFNIFLILTAYYVMKPVREALILAQPGGAEIKS
jgi:ATP:ADP antiporter, AAA family